MTSVLADSVHERALIPVDDLGGMLEEHLVRRTLVAEALIALRRGESFDLVALKVKARLTQRYPTLSILPVLGPQRDAMTTVECFGMTFKSKHAFTAADRRFLKSAAQLLSMLDECRDDMDAAGLRQGVEPGAERSFRIVGRAEPRRQHDGSGRPLGSERGYGGQR